MLFPDWLTPQNFSQPIKCETSATLSPSSSAKSCRSWASISSSPRTFVRWTSYIADVNIFQLIKLLYTWDLTWLSIFTLRLWDRADSWDRASDLIKLQYFCCRTEGDGITVCGLILHWPGTVETTYSQAQNKGPLPTSNLYQSWWWK